MRAPVMAKLHAAFGKALADKDIVGKLEGQGVTPDPSPSPQAFAAFVTDNAARWSSIVKQSGARID